MPGSPSRVVRPVALLCAAMLVLFADGCRTEPLTDLTEARRLVAELQVQFTKTVEASNRAVMADTDTASEDAAREARAATSAVERTASELRRHLESLGYRDEMSRLADFARGFEEYKGFDEQILPLAVENTNLKAQQLLFEDAQRASDEFRRAMDDAAAGLPPGRTPEPRAAAARAAIAVLETQVILARHIPEIDAGAMARMESEIDERRREARSALDAAGQGTRGPAREALDRFDAVAARIVSLSRRNTNVQSLALSLGRKRVVTIRCDERLDALARAVLAHGFSATR